MKFIKCTDDSRGIGDMVNILHREIDADKKVLWLVPGGSNIKSAVKILDVLKLKIPSYKLKQLTVTLTDERYGEFNHIDSNWRQLTELGFDFDVVQTIPILMKTEKNKHASLDKTVSNWQKSIKKAFDKNDVIIGFFGMGSDGHTAGILPHTKAVESKDLVCGYNSEKFTRITLTPNFIKNIDYAFLMAFGESKKSQLVDLRDKDIVLDEQPVQVLKQINNLTVYSDQV